jgi:NADH:ubiquinone oxidoreductase subunit 6 (subunit J)
MKLQSILFYAFIVGAATSAIGLLFIKNLFKGALLLLICLLSIAALYIFSFAEFVAVTQIMIYAGGIVIVVIFGIMLTSRLSGSALKVQNANVFSGTLIGVSLFYILSTASKSFATNPQIPNTAEGQLEQTGVALMSTFSLPFEISGVLLLIALIGGAMVSSDKPDIK